MGQIVSIQTGKIRKYETPQPWTTATFKEVVNGPVRLGWEGLEGDQQADRRYHGGKDKAVLAYSHDHYALWDAEGVFAEPLPAGAFGENLLVAGMKEQDVCVGDTYRLGTARVQVSQPRQPCSKQARRWGVKDLVVQMIRKERAGWYLRVLEEGVVTAGDQLVLESRPHPEWTVAAANRVYHVDKEDLAAAARLLACAELAEAWKKDLRARVG